MGRSFQNPLIQGKRSMFQFTKPDSDIRNRYGLEGIWVLNHESGDQSDDLILPDAHCDIIFAWSGRTQTFKGIWLTGFENRSRKHHIRQGDRFIGIQFHPGALPYLPVAEIGNQSVDLHSVNRKQSLSLQAHFEKSIKQKSLNPLFQWVAEFAGEADGDLLATTFPLRSRSDFTSPGDWAQTRSISIRTLERKFQKSTGMTPSMVGKILRFQRVYQLAQRYKKNGKSIHLSTLALEAGYSDQSHMSREIRLFTDRTALNFFQHHVAFIQDHPDFHVLDWVP